MFNSDKKNNYIRIIIIILAIIFISIGIIRSEYLLVLRKATKICLECIGIG